MKERFPDELPKTSMSYQNVRVIAQSGYRGEEKPRAFFIDNEEINVVEIMDMWIEEGLFGKTRKRFFIVKGNDNQKYRIYIDEETLKWFCEMKTPRHRDCGVLKI